MSSLYIHANCYKKILLFFWSSIRMSRNNVIFEDKKIKKSDSYKKQKSNQDR